MHKHSGQKVIQISLVIAGILVFGSIQYAVAQSTFHKPTRRSQNELEIRGPYLKTIYNFSPARFDTIQLSGYDPVLLARYQDDRLTPLIFDAVLRNQISVYNPNFWGSVPHLIEKENHEEFDTLKVLNYLSAGWDTSLMIGMDETMETIPEYREIPYEEISGLFFFESWWLDRKSNRLFKDVHAYLPIREYLASVYEGYDNTELRKRLLFMIIPDWSTGSEKSVKYRPGDFHPLWQNIDYKVELYNKPYDTYLYREEESGEISQTEYHEWQYHSFDFYRFFDANFFLEKIINGILSGKLNANKPGQADTSFNRDEFIKLLRNIPENSGLDELHDSDMIPENYPLSDLNSLVFHEDWYINPENLQIYKDVRGITVNRHENQYDKYTGEFMQGTVNPLFTVWFK
ncbi:MAG TPA: hypothetical protein ENI20_07055 [Bacteroides sp.]|nr:hypothetical protein [Bacteroides sp.]